MTPEQFAEWDKQPVAAKIADLTRRARIESAAQAVAAALDNTDFPPWQQGIINGMRDALAGK